ncbi:MAG: tetraacyldisaccharide 4'-kinase [Rickettsiales bacterium]|jgi:tetraacyldisaccharide 4'-kinase|nr:tetraacyldisaccharide 4'-kinase [Rickettsiales bacterium]
MLSFFAKRSLRSYLLLPFSCLFLLIVRCRQKWIKSHNFAQYAIVIGNATIGGGGKTPSSLAMGKVLSDIGYNYNYLTKGYKGSIVGPAVINLTEDTVLQTGDEARLLAKQQKTFIAKQRHKAIAFLKDNAEEIIILDDGFQNIHINCDLNILVIDEHYGFGNGLILPAGPLRDTIDWHIAKADCIFIVSNLDADLNSSLTKRLSSKPIFYLKARLISEIDLSKNYLVFSALANNTKFSKFLLEHKVNISQVINYNDHHKYSSKDYEDIIAKAKAQDLSIITTEKDAVKIDDTQLHDYVICRMQLEFANKEDFIKFIKNKLK